MDLPGKCRPTLGLLMLVCLSLRHVEGAFNKDQYVKEAGQTLDALFKKEMPDIRPPIEKTAVTLGLRLMHISNVDIRKQSLQTVWDVNITWMDPRLKWSPRIVNYVYLNTSRVWIPDVVATNIVQPAINLYPEKVIVGPGGKVTYPKKELWTTHCGNELTAHAHICKIHLAFHSRRPDRVFSNPNSWQLASEYKGNRVWDPPINVKSEGASRSKVTIEITMWQKAGSRNLATMGSGSTGSVTGAITIQNALTTTFLATKLLAALM